MNPWLKRGLWLMLLALLAVALRRALTEPLLWVDVAVIERGPLSVTVDDDGRTRPVERYTISAPVDGELLRPPLQAGAAVEAGVTVVAELVPRVPTLLDARSQAEAEASAEGARAAVERAQALLTEARADLEFAQRELARRTELLAGGSTPQQEVDRAVRDERAAAAAERAAQLAVQIAEHERELAEATLLRNPLSGEPAGALPPTLALRSPIDGLVMNVVEESARSVSAGTPLIEVANLERLEIVADFLSQDAVQLRPGMEVRIDGWGAERRDLPERRLRGRGRIVEPAGFTKISALGVEEQRVNVLIDPLGDDDAWSRLQSGYRVALHVVVAELEDVVLVPTGALFRVQDEWSVFVVEAGRAAVRRVTLGERTGLECEVRDGLTAGEQVILYPSELVAEGRSVEAR